MTYLLRVSPHYWLTEETGIYITRKNQSLRYLEEILTHPEKRITAVRLYYMFEAFQKAEFSSSLLDYESLRSGDYVNNCYEQAVEEQNRGIKYFREYETLEQLMNEKLYQCSLTEAEYYREKIMEFRKLIIDMTKVETHLDDFINKVNHKVYCEVTRSIRMMKDECPILHEHISKTVKMGFSFIYEHEDDPDFDLIIREDDPKTHPKGFSKESDKPNH